MKTEVTNIYTAMKAAGVQIENHATDMYVPVNDTTKAIIEEYASKSIVSRFISQIDKQWWFDIPFAYAPAWERKAA